MHGMVVGILSTPGWFAVGKLGIVNDETVLLPAGHIFSTTNARVTRNLDDKGNL